MKRLASRVALMIFRAIAASSRRRRSQLRSCDSALVTALAAGIATMITVLSGCGHASPAAPTATTPAPSPASVQASGRVYDTLTRPVGDARVEVIDGPSVGTATITSADGAFTLGVTLSPGTRLRATKAGYESAVVPLPQSAEITVWLRAEGTVNLTGKYIVSVEADPECADLPAAARHRTYDATVVSAGGPGAPLVTATLLNPTLDGYFRVLYLRVGGDTVNFDLSDNGVVEEIADEVYYSLGGFGVASGATESTVSATFNGAIDYCVVNPGAASFWPCAGAVLAHQQCQSAHHRLILTRR